MRLQGAAYATSIAEYFRDQGSPRTADHGLAHPLRDGATRDCTGHRRTAGHARLPTVGIRAPAANSSNAPVTAPTKAARSPRSTRCLLRGDGPAGTRSPTRHAPFSTATSFFREHWPTLGITRRSTSKQSISRAMVNLIEPTHLEQIRHFKQHYSRFQTLARPDQRRRLRRRLRSAARPGDQALPVVSNTFCNRT